MKILFSLFLSLIFSFTTFAQSQQNDLIKLDSKDLGIDPAEFEMKVTEVERVKNTSKVKVQFRKGGSVALAMFVVESVYIIAKSRNYAYFVTLDEYPDDSGNIIQIYGFTNERAADIKKEFGQEYEYADESGRQREIYSVKELELFYQLAIPKTKQIETTKKID